MSPHIRKFKLKKQLRGENEKQGPLIEGKYEKRKGSQNRVNIPGKFRLCR